MPLLDDHGRLFGKVNLIDAAAAAFVLVLVPLGYAAYVLFKVPAPKVTAIKPLTFDTTKGQVLDVEGEHLRPFLRASVGDKSAEYLFATVDRGQVKLPELPPGAYEVKLYDESQLVATAGTITVNAPPPQAQQQPPPGVDLTVLGTFGRLDPAQVSMLRPGARFAWNRGDRVKHDENTAAMAPIEWLEVLAVLPPRTDVVAVQDSVVIGAHVEGKKQVAAVARLRAALVGRDLKVQDTRIAPGVELLVPVPATGADPAGTTAQAPLLFSVVRMYPAQTTPVDVHVRFVTRPDVVAVVQREQAAATSVPAAFRALSPQILSFRVTSELLGETKLELREGRLSIVESTVRVPAVRTVDGWMHQGRVLRAGAEYTLDAPTYSITGVILSTAVVGGRP